MEIYAELALHNTDLLPYGDSTYKIVDEAAGGVIAYCHSDNADRIVAALNTHDPKLTPATDLGSLINALASCDPDAQVLLDYNGELVQPGKPTYYRGCHNELALRPDGTKPITVADMFYTLREIRVYGFTRPGIETEASDTTGVWVAKHREPSGLHVTGVRNDGGTVVILSAKK